MKHFKNLLLSIVAVAVMILGGVWFTAHPPVAAGATLPFAGNTYNLAGSGVSSSATSFTLTSMTIKQTGQPIQDADLGDVFYLTIEPGSNSKQEIVGCTTVGTNTGSTVTVSGCSRGLAPISPYTASTTLAFTHGGGSQVIFSNPPQLFNLYYALANAGTSTNTLVFSSTTPPHYDSVGVQAVGSAIATSAEFASVAYVNAVSFSGTSNASESVKGISEFATAIETASSTLLGGTGAGLVLQSKYASSSYTPGINLNIIPVTNLLGFLNPQFISTTSGSAYNFGGPIGFTGSTTYSGLSTTTIFNKLQIAASAVTPLWLNGLAYSWFGARGASSTVLSEDGAGNLSFQMPNMRLLVATTTQQNMTSASTTFAAATNIKVVIAIAGTGGANSLVVSFNNDSGANYGSAYSDDNVLTKASAASSLALSNISTTSAALITMDVYNQTAIRKLMNWTIDYTAATAQAPTITTGTGVWSNTSSQINNLKIATGGGQTITAGTYIAIYGSSN